MITPREVPYRTNWEVYRSAVHWINLKSAQDDKQISHAFILDNSVPADGLAKVVHTNTEEILYQNIHLSPRLPPKVILRTAWQVQHEGHAQREDSTGELLADETTIEPKINYRIHGIAQAEN